jgi:hypothetical protein
MSFGRKKDLEFFWNSLEVNYTTIQIYNYIVSHTNTMDFCPFSEEFCIMDSLGPRHNLLSPHKYVI